MQCYHTVVFQYNYISFIEYYHKLHDVDTMHQLSRSSFLVWCMGWFQNILSCCLKSTNLKYLVISPNNHSTLTRTLFIALLYCLIYPLLMRHYFGMVAEGGPSMGRLGHHIDIMGCRLVQRHTIMPEVLHQAWLSKYLNKAKQNI
jgi:hypothetical protein